MDQQKLKQTILNFLNAHRKMVLTVLDRDKHPNSSLMLFAADDDLRIYFGTKKSFGKYKALSADPYVSLAIVQENIDPLQVVDMQGTVKEISKEKIPETLKWFIGKNPAEYYVKGADDFVMFQIIPFVVRWLDAASGDLCMYDLNKNFLPADLPAEK